MRPTQRVDTIPQIIRYKIILHPLFDNLNLSKMDKISEKQEGESMSDTSSMPENWPSLNLPFPLRCSPHADITRRRTREWAIDMGMLPDDSSRNWWDKVDLTGFEAWCFPDAAADRLLIADKWTAIGIMFDDQFDNTDLGRQPDKASRVINTMVEVTRSEGRQDSEHQQPFARALGHLMNDLREIMSEAWIARHRRHLISWWDGVIQAASHRAEGISPMSFDERLALRRLTVGMDAFGDLIEVTCGWEIPDALFALPEVQRIREIVRDLTLFLNDLYSVERERADGNDDNVLLAWESEGLTPAAARARSATHINRLADDFVKLTAHPFSIAGTSCLRDSDLQGLSRWVRACALYLGGAHHSQEIAPRYTNFNSRLAYDHKLALNLS